MKGVVFTEFIEMVEDVFSPEVADEMISSSNLPSNGQYTSVGTYDHTEMVRLVSELSRLTGVDIALLLQRYGEFLFTKFAKGYPVFFEDTEGAFDLLKSIEGYIHIEVKKLYPDSELPSFEYKEPTEKELVLTYRSPRGLGHFARGLINGCILHFNEAIDVNQVDLSNGRAEVVEFTLTQVNE